MPERINLSLDRYIGIDYSGAATPTSSLKGLRAFEAGHESLPEEVAPPPARANTGPDAVWQNG